MARLEEIRRSERAPRRPARARRRRGRAARARGQGDRGDGLLDPLDRGGRDAQRRSSCSTGSPRATSRALRAMLDRRRAAGDPLAQPRRHRAGEPSGTGSSSARRSRAARRRCSTTTTSATTTTATGTCSRRWRRRLTVRALYHRWHPQIVHDVHQMGAPRRAALRAALHRPLGAQRRPRAHRARSSALGSHVAARLTTEGRTGHRHGRALRRLDARARVPAHATAACASCRRPPRRGSPRRSR